MSSSPEFRGIRAHAVKLAPADPNKLVQSASWIYAFSSHPVRAHSKCPLLGADYAGLQAEAELISGFHIRPREPQKCPFQHE
mmetsp:Transcript_10933/g.33524  ORF Transcript_10933/g.33524 Transcript_10933/m.33524 type:complete len:82 (-) Transcript_10933:2821-3066(-)